MGCRGALLRGRRWLRDWRFSSAISPTAEVEIENCYKRLDPTFENAREAFKNNQRLLQVLRRVLGPWFFRRVLKATFYGHFVAGETRAEVEPTVQRLCKYGVKAILDYSVESDISQEEAEAKAVEGVTQDANIDQSGSPTTGVLDAAEVKQVHDRYSPHKEFGDRREKVVSARTYFYAGERECDRNRDIFCESIDAVAAAAGGGFAAIKLTALGRPHLLLRLSETIAQTQNFFRVLTGSTWHNLVLSRINEREFLARLKEFGVRTDSEDVQSWFKTVDFDDDGFVDFYEWGRLLDDSHRLGQLFHVFNLSTGAMQPLIRHLTDSEQSELSNMMQRIMHVAEHALSRGVRIMIDAEQTYFQAAISRLTLELMRRCSPPSLAHRPFRYNKNHGHIFNTYQAYLRNAFTNLELDMHLAARENFHFGAKLVRGAYMDQERKRARAIGYEDPINPTYEVLILPDRRTCIQATTEMYERVLTRIVEERVTRGAGQVSVMVASHNEETVRFAIELMRANHIAPSERTVCFAQLYGMCDQVSFSLGQAGYSVYKYLPYGPIEGVLPYLSRRALENGQMLKKVEKERRMLWTELKRRVRAGQWRYNPA